MNTKNFNVEAVYAIFGCTCCGDEVRFSFEDVAEVDMPECCDEDCDNFGEDLTPHT